MPASSLSAALKPSRRLRRRKAGALLWAQSMLTALLLVTAGIGRTGTFCTVDVVLRRLRAMATGDIHGAKAAVEIRTIVEALRQQRMGMVQTPDQYLFCHLAVKEELEELLHGATRARLTKGFLVVTSF